ncbi:hypothetical protein [Methanoregula sp.]|jgi:hypothetical protein|uniref:hypothetical protein n=1 Tax=Methanoregula sp. TaxID=2052170 RepID=UPI003564EF19
MPELETLSLDEVINRIVALNEGLTDFWTQSGGWAPIESAQLLSKSRLDWQVSLSRSLKIWLTVPLPDEENGRLILAWANLGTLVEGTLKLFLSVYYNDYKKDNKSIKRKKKDLTDPDSLYFQEIRLFFKKRIWCKGGYNWNTWIEKIQQRRNAIHAYQNRDIGTFDEFFEDIRQYLIFLQEINARLPYPDDIYVPREY